MDEQGKLVGIVTNRDMRFASQSNTPVRVMMTSENLAVLQEPADRNEAINLMKARRIEKLLVSDQSGKLTGLLTLKDTEQAVLNPTACKDELGRLRVAAATTVGDAGFERSEALIDAGVDMVVIDTAHGHSEGVAAAVTRIKKLSNAIQVVAGNVATAGDKGPDRRGCRCGKGWDRPRIHLYNADCGWRWCPSADRHYGMR